MSEVIVFPDVEELFIGYLTDELPAFGSTATAHDAVPPTRTPEFVVVKRIGGPRRDLVSDSATVTFECWGATPKGAHDLAQLVRGIVGASRGRSVDGHRVYAVSEFAGPGSLPDPDSDQPRYVFTASIAVRGRARERED